MMNKKIICMAIFCTLIVVGFSQSSASELEKPKIKKLNDNITNIIEEQQLESFFTILEDIKNEYSYEDSPELYNAIEKSIKNDETGNIIPFNLQTFEEELEKTSKTLDGGIPHWRHITKIQHLYVRSNSDDLEISGSKLFFEYSLKSPSYGISIRAIDPTQIHPSMGNCDKVYIRDGSIIYNSPDLGLKMTAHGVLAHGYGFFNPPGAKNKLLLFQKIIISYPIFNKIFTLFPNLTEFV